MTYTDSVRQALSLTLLAAAGQYERGIGSDSRAVRRAALRAKALGVVMQARFLDGRPIRPN